jgi:hypothetical protein
MLCYERTLNTKMVEARLTSNKTAIKTSTLISLLKEKIYGALLAEDHIDEDSGVVTPALSAKDLSSLVSSTINISKHEQELREKQGLGNKVMAFPALPPVENKQA